MSEITFTGETAFSLDFSKFQIYFRKTKFAASLVVLKATSVLYISLFFLFSWSDGGDYLQLTG